MSSTAKPWHGFPGTAVLPGKRRNLVAACLGHVLHDGYTDALYAFLPVWQTQFGLSYAGLALIRALYSGTMGGLQLPAARLVKGWSPRAALSLCTLIAASGFLLMLLPLGLAGLCFGLVLAGIGSSIQHPRGSLLVTESFAPSSRGALGVYNFSGDLGKAALPAMVALLLPLIAWKPVAGLLAALGVLAAGGLWLLAPRTVPAAQKAKPAVEEEGVSRRGFALLMAIGGADTATRMGYLLFLPFLIHASGGASPTVGLGLALLFLGGALGKATCSWLGEKLGVINCVILTEGATVLLIVTTMYVPLVGMLAILPILGIVLNGTSSVLYGTVPELAPRRDAGRAFAMFYTAVLGAGGLAPIAYGAIADHTSRATGVLAAAATAAAIIPMVMGLRSSLRETGFHKQTEVMRCGRRLGEGKGNVIAEPCASKWYWQMGLTQSAAALALIAGCAAPLLSLPRRMRSTYCRARRRW